MCATAFNSGVPDLVGQTGKYGNTYDYLLYCIKTPQPSGLDKKNNYLSGLDKKTITFRV